MAIGFFTLTVLLSPLALNVQQAPRPPEAKDLPVLVRAAQQALERKDYAGAVKALKAALEIDAGSPELWFNLAYAHTGLHENDEAVRAYQQSLQLRPDLFEARLNLGILFLEMKRPQESLEHLARAAALRPANPRAHLYYGRALAQVGQTEEAEKQFAEAARLDPALAAISSFDLGQLDLAQKHYRDALEAFKKAASLDPKLAQAQLGMALAEEGLHQSAEAEVRFEKYLAAQPQDLETRFHLGRLYLEAGETEKALTHLRIVDQARPETPGLAAALGDAFALLKKFPESEKYYRLALRTAPGEPDLHRALGRTLLDEQKLDEAEGEFRTAFKLDPKNLEALKGLASCLYLEKRFAEAIPVFQAVLARDPKAPPGLYFVLATCYDHLRDNRTALRTYERFLELSHHENQDEEWKARQRVKLLERELSK